MRQKFVAGNWKMNLLRQSAEELAAAVAKAFPVKLTGVQVAVCPPFPYLLTVQSAMAGSGVELGAQDAYFEAPGAFTGEIAADMLRDVGCDWVILGHSERRLILGETDELVSRKIAAVLRGGLKVILCVGETLAQRQANQTESVLDKQLEGSLSGIDAAAMANVVIAYEPVWAIGTGVTATTEQAQSAHAHLRRRLAIRYNSEVAEATRIQYGGSVKPDNAVALLGQPDVDGALVGGASLKAADFVAIVRAAESLARG